MRFRRHDSVLSTGIGIMVLLLWTALHAVAAHADALKLSGFWIENVEVRSIESGELIYLTRGTEFRRPLSEVEGMRLEKHPQIEQAAAAVAAGQDANAVNLLQDVRKTAEGDWLKHYVDWQLVGALDRLGRGKAAVGRYAGLVLAKADPFFLTNPPVASATAMSSEDKASVADQVKRALSATKDEQVRAALEQLRDALVVQQAPGGVAEPGKPSGAAPTTPAVELPIVIPDNLSDSTPLKLLREGKTQEALKEASTQVQIAGGLSEKLMTKGLIELTLAETAKGVSEAERIKLYQEAGLSFMRVVVFFPVSKSAAPALLEAGYVHQKIGREDIAQELFNEASLALERDRDDYPNYYKRLLQLTGAAADGGASTP